MVSETYFEAFWYKTGLKPPGGGGGGTQIWFRRGCAAEAAKPVPIFKGISSHLQPLNFKVVCICYINIYRLLLLIFCWSEKDCNWLLSE